MFQENLDGYFGIVPAITDGGMFWFFYFYIPFYSWKPSLFLIPESLVSGSCEKYQTSAFEKMSSNIKFAI